jgi:protein tyrosine phosphatase
LRFPADVPILPVDMKIVTFQWVIEGRLVKGKRPGFLGRAARPVSKAKVDTWLRTAKDRFEVRSIICLLDERHLRLYSQIPGGLIRFYRSRGFNVALIRVPNRHIMNQSHLSAIRVAYRKFASAPVLVHCSAGRGRTGKAVAYIKACFHSR